MDFKIEKNVPMNTRMEMGEMTYQDAIARRDHMREFAPDLRWTVVDRENGFAVINMRWWTGGKYDLSETEKRMEMLK